MQTGFTTMDQITQAPARLGDGDEGIRILVADRSAHYRETIRRVLVSTRAFLEG